MTVTKRIATNEASPDFIKQLAGYGLATAEIFIICLIIHACCRPIYGKIMILHRIFRFSLNS